MTLKVEITAAHLSGSRPYAETFTEVKQHRQQLQTLLADLADTHAELACDPRVVEALKLGKQ